MKKLLYSRKELPALLSLSLNTAVKFAKEAGAEVRFGGRTVYSYEQIQKHIKKITNEKENENVRD